MTTRPAAVPAAGVPVTRTRWSAVVTFALATLLVVSELSMAAFVLPLIAVDLGVTPATTAWVVLAYSLPLAALALPAGRWVDRADIRTVFVVSLLAISVAGAVAAAAPTFWFLLVVRVVQGVASALYLAVHLPVVTAAVRPDQHGRAISTITMIMMLGSIALAPLGGYVAAAWGWRAVFLAKAPLLVLVVAIGTRAIPRSDTGGGPAMPAPGRSMVGEVLLLGGAVAAALLAVEQFGAWTVSGGLVVLASVLLLFWSRTRASRPVRRLARDLPLGLPALALLLTASTMGLVVFSLPYFIAEVIRASPDLLGLAMLCFVAVASVSAPVAGALADRHRPLPVAIIGGVITVAAVLTLLTLTADAGLFALGWRMGLMGVGMGLFNAPTVTAILQATPAGQSGTAGGLTNLARTLGSTVGPAAAAAAWHLAGGGAPGFDAGVWVLANFTAIGVLALAGAWASVTRLPAGAPAVTAGVPRAVVNPRLGQLPVPAPPGAEVGEFHRAMPGYAPTPLRSLPGLADALGLAAVAVKDESDRCGLPAFKILGASWAVARALEHDPDVHTLVAASAGNHGRAVARCAAQRGLAGRIYLPAGASPARIEAIAAEGAQVIEVEGGYDAAVAVADRAARTPGAVLIADVSYRPDAGPPAWVVDGYATLFREVARQLTDPVQVLLVPVGVGSLAAAAVRWAANEGGGAAVVGVEPMTAGCVTASLAGGRPVAVDTPGTSMAGLDCANPSVAAWPSLAAGLAGTVTVDDDEAVAALRELAGHRMAVGESGAASLAGLRALVGDPRCAALRAAIGLGPASRVLCVATEGPTDPVSYRAALAG